MLIRVLDFESTGDSPDGDKQGLCEIAYVDVVSTSVDLAGGPLDWVIAPIDPARQSRLVNPGVPIPPETAAVHNIIDDDVADARPWKHALAALVKASVEDGVDYWAAHGADMEKLWFHIDWWFAAGRDPIPFLDTYKAALRLWPEAPLFSNAGLRYHRKPVGLIREMAFPTHRALPDAYVTAHHIRDMLNEGAAIAKILEWSNEPALTIRCYVGDWRKGGKGTPWPEVDTGMLRWIVDKYDKPDIVYTAQHHLTLRAEAERAERERAELDAQLKANGLPLGPVEDGAPAPPAGPAPEQPDPNQESLPL